MQDLKITMKDPILKKNGKKSVMDSIKKKCEFCGAPYRKIDQVFVVSKKKRDHSYFVPNCDCEEKRKIRQDKKEQGKRLAQRIKELKDCGINLRYKGKTFSNFNRSLNLVAYNLSLSYAKIFKKNNRKESLFLFGKVGTGKTHIAVAIVDYIARLRNKLIKSEIVFINIVDLLDNLKISFIKGGHEKIISKYKHCDLLIIDDLGIEKISDWSLETIHKIIDYRYRDKMPTIITSNLKLDEIKDIYGERIFSRIYEMCQIVNLIGEDYRLKGNI